MAKDKEKHSKKNDLSDDLLDTVALSIKKFRKVTREIGKLSTGQKLVGGLAYLALRPASADEASASAPHLPQVRAGHPTQADATELPRKSKKYPEPKPQAGL